MTSKIILGASVALLIAAPGAQALAQSRSRAAPAAAAPTATAPAAARPAAPALKFGPAIPGVCVFSEERAVGTSKAGQSANARMTQLKAQVQAELQPEGTTLQNDVRTFQSQRATLTGDALTQRETALQGRVQAFQQKEQLRNAELQQTGGKALDRIRVEIDPLVRASFEQHGCSLLLNGDNAVFGVNPQMDLTPSVVSALDTKLPSITFDREHIDPNAAAAAAR